MKRKNAYSAPRILKQTAFAPQNALLAGSIVDTTVITATGQETQDYDFSGNGFNHDWQ